MTQARLTFGASPSLLSEALAGLFQCIGPNETASTSTLPAQLPYVRQWWCTPNTGSLFPATVTSTVGDTGQHGGGLRGATLPGSTLICFSTFSYDVSNTATIIDSQGQSWPFVLKKADTSAPTLGHQWLQCNVMQNSVALSATDTITMGAAYTDYEGFIIIEVANAAAVSLLASNSTWQQSISGTASDNLNSGVLAAQQGNVLFVATCTQTTQAGSAPYIPLTGTGYTGGGTWFANPNATPANAYIGWFETLNATNPGATTPTFTAPTGSPANNYLSIGLAIQGVGSTGGGGPPGTFSGYDGVIQVFGGKLCNGNQSPIILAGGNLQGLDYVSVQGGTNPWDFGGGNNPGAPNWPLYASYGMNCVRLQITGASWLGDTVYDISGGNSWGPGRSADPGNNFRQTVIDAVASANKYGMYVMIALQGTAPDLTLGGVTHHLAPNAVMAVGDVNSLRFWQSIAATFGTQATPPTSSIGPINNASVIFDLLNEPHPSYNYGPYKSGAGGTGSTLTAEQVLLNGGYGGQWPYSNLGSNGGASGTVSQWQPVVGYQQMVNAIEAAGAQNVWVLEGDKYCRTLSTGLSYLPTSKFKQGCFSIHSYAAPGSYPETGQYVYCETDEADGSSGTANCLHFAQALVNAGYPVLIGEDGGFCGFGCTNGEPHLTWVCARVADGTVSGIFIFALNPRNTSTSGSDIERYATFGSGVGNGVYPTYGQGQVFTSFCATVAALQSPMAMISRGVPAYGSTGTGSNGNDASYNTVWTSTAVPATLAYDLSQVNPGSRQKILLVWYNDSTYEYDHSKYVSGQSGYNNLGSYTVQGNTGAGGGSPPGSGWVTLATVSGNTLHSKQHVLTGVGSYNWIRINATASDGTGGSTNIACNMDLYNASVTNIDGWFFCGDSITANCMGHQNFSTANSDSFTNQVGALIKIFPPQECAGQSGWATSDWLTVLAGYLASFPGQYVPICLGSNDAYGSVSNATFKSNLQQLCVLVQNAGCTPILPTVPWSNPANGGPSTTITQGYNTQIAAILAANPSYIQGPDLYAFFNANQSYISGDGVHPTDAGGAALRALWANFAAAQVY